MKTPMVRDLIASVGILPGIHCVVYRMYDIDGVLLYVGSTHNLRQRLAAHKATKQWWGEIQRIEIARFESRAEMLDAERCAIYAEGPAYNSVVPSPMVGLREANRGEHLLGTPQLEVHRPSREAVHEEPNQGPLLTTHDIADQLDTSYENARKVLLRAGYQPVHVIGRNNLWSKQQLSDLLQRRKWKAQTPPIHRMTSQENRGEVQSTAP